MTGTAEYLDTLFGQCTGGLSLSWLEDTKLNSTYCTDPEALLHKVSLLNGSTTGTYVRMTTLDHQPSRGRGTSADSRELVCLWADVDYGTVGHKHDPAEHGGLELPGDEETAIGLVASAGLPRPTVVVHSGGGLYPLWLLTEPWVLDDDGRRQAGELSRRWNAQLAAGAAAQGLYYGAGMGDLARVLRLPGTVNRKEGLERPCRVLSDDGPRYTRHELEEALADAELLYGVDVAGVTDTRTGELTLTDEQREQLDFRDAVEPGIFQRLHAQVGIGGVLLAAGWSECGCGRPGTVSCWTRPGEPESRHSAHVLSAEPHVLVVHSAEAPLPAGGGQRLTAGRIFAHLHHEGDLSAAAKDLADAEHGGGSEEAQALEGWRKDDKAGWEKIFNATPVLRHILASARAGGGPAPLLLGNVLARVALEVPIGFRLPGQEDGSIGTRAELNFGVLVSAETGSGKSSTFGRSRRLLGVDQRAQEAPSGTGEGLQQIYLRERTVTDSEGVKSKELVLKEDPRYLFRIDEINEFNAKKDTRGGIIVPTLCSMLMGEMSGAVLASEGRSRILPASSYRFCMVIGAQPENTGPLLHDQASGTPQRFLWVPEADPMLTWLGEDDEEAPEDPGSLDWRCPVPELFGDEEVMAVPERIKRLMYRTYRNRNVAPENRPEGVPAPDPRESHLLLMRLKTAALLALLHGDTEVTELWWDLAGELVALSLAEQEKCLRRLAEVERTASVMRAETEGRMAVVRDSAMRSEIEKRKRVRERMLKHLAGTGDEGMSGGDLMRKFAAGERDLADRIRDELLAEGLVGVEYGEYRGRAKEIYRLEDDRQIVQTDEGV